MRSDESSLEAGFVDVVVIGAGHAGLAVSYYLTQRSIPHVVLERGEVANSWRTERWKSLKLLTPNWQTRLPGFGYRGGNPDGFMSMPELIQFLDNYANSFSAPVRTQTSVQSVSAGDGGYVVKTNRGVYRSNAVVIASGACNECVVPRVSTQMPQAIQSVTPHSYRSPDDIAEGGVLVVGGSATGLQLAKEIHSSSRPVTLAVGEHVRLPRTYRGRDIQWWMDAAGILDERYDELEDIDRARRLPSPQLAGNNDSQLLDLNAVQALGIRVAGRLMGVADGKAQFSGSLANVCSLADLKLGRLLDTVDLWAEQHLQANDCEPSERFAETELPQSPLLSLDLEGQGIKTALWATGFKPDYGWLEVPVLNKKGHIVHDGGTTCAPGLYVTGLPVLRKRKSSFIHGAQDDAHAITTHLTQYLRTSIYTNRACA